MLPAAIGPYSQVGGLLKSTKRERTTLLCSDNNWSDPHLDLKENKYLNLLDVLEDQVKAEYLKHNITRK